MYHGDGNESQGSELHMVRKEGEMEKRDRARPHRYIRREWISGCWQWPVTRLLKCRLKIRHYTIIVLYELK